MAQATFGGREATIVFDDAEMVTVTRALLLDKDFLTKCVTEFLTALARQQNLAATMNAIERQRAGQFGRLGSMNLG